MKLFNSERTEIDNDTKSVPKVSRNVCVSVGSEQGIESTPTLVENTFFLFLFLVVPVNFREFTRSRGLNL